MAEAHPDQRDDGLDEFPGSVSSVCDKEGEDESSSLFSDFSSDSSQSETNIVIPGRWVDPKKFTEHPLPCVDGFGAALSGFASFCSFLTSSSCDTSDSADRRFFEEKEFLLLDEALLSKVFALLICVKLSKELPGHEAELRFFAGLWVDSVRGLVEILQAKTKDFTIREEARQ